MPIELAGQVALPAVAASAGSAPLTGKPAGGRLVVLVQLALVPKLAIALADPAALGRYGIQRSAI